MTTSALQPPALHSKKPDVRPERVELIADMLGGIERDGVPIRSAFIQKPRDGQAPRGNMLATLSRNEFALDAYLLTHALASASPPYNTKWPLETWVQVTRYDEHRPDLDESRAAWGRGARVLERHRLIKRKQARHHVHLELLHESGSGEEYTRPTEHDHGTWFTLPHAYWLDGFDTSLSFAAKRMLLVSLDQPDQFRLPAERALQWYGVSETSAQTGLAELVKREILQREEGWAVAARSKTGWRQVMTYTATGVWSNKSRRKKRPTAPKFEEAAE